MSLFARPEFVMIELLPAGVWRLKLALGDDRVTMIYALEAADVFRAAKTELAARDARKEAA